MDVETLQKVILALGLVASLALTYIYFAPIGFCKLCKHCQEIKKEERRKKKEADDKFWSYFTDNYPKKRK